MADNKKIRTVFMEDGSLKMVVREHFDIFACDFPAEDVLFTPWEDTPAMRVTVRIGNAEDIYTADSVSLSKGVLTVREDGGMSVEYPLDSVARLDVDGVKRRGKAFFSGKRVYGIKERAIHRAAREAAREAEYKAAEAVLAEDAGRDKAYWDEKWEEFLGGGFDD